MDSFSDVAQAAERRRVLEMLERGQIGAAEADEIMTALESRSGAEGSRAQGPLRPSPERPASVPTLVAVAAGLARALAKTIACLSTALARVIGAVARLRRRARRLWRVARES